VGGSEVRVTITRQGQHKRLILVEIRFPFFEELQTQARAEMTTPARLISDAIEAIVPPEKRRRYVTPVTKSDGFYPSTPASSSVGTESS
jgi:hypothetical protein